jgi:putative endonuclease
MAAKRDAYAFGRYAETQATAWLEKRGYTILQRNYRTRAAEVDIIASMDGILAFVEVKARANAAYGLPCEAVTLRKQTRIAQAAQSWLYEQDLSDSYARFDVIEIYPGRIRHIRNAFETPEAAA